MWHIFCAKYTKEKLHVSFYKTANKKYQKLKWLSYIFQIDSKARTDHKCLLFWLALCFTLIKERRNFEEKLNNFVKGDLLR